MAKFAKARIDEASSSASSQISDSLFKLFEPAPPHSIDVIFFHGLQFEAHEGRFQPTSDGYLSTWRSGDALQEVWPQRWLPAKYPGARILMVSYDASIKTTGTEGMMDMHLIGEKLLEEIVWVRGRLGKECPVVFVGHSFGGLVTKQLCLHAYRNKETRLFLSGLFVDVWREHNDLENGRRWSRSAIALWTIIIHQLLLSGG